MNKPITQLIHQDRGSAEKSRKMVVKRKKILKPVAVTKTDNKAPSGNTNLKKISRGEQSTSQSRNRSESIMTNGRRRVLNNTPAAVLNNN